MTTTSAADDLFTIPTSFFIDENGVILAKKLRGMGIDKAVDAHVKKFK
jgi:hypothetical protein